MLTLTRRKHTLRVGSPGQQRLEGDLDGDRVSAAGLAGLAHSTSEGAPGIFGHRRGDR